jgi:intergrase/recombinase
MRLGKAAILKSKGLLELDMRLRAAGEDIVRYEVWRLEPEYMKAYLTAIKRYYGTKRQQEKWETELRVLLDKASVKEVVG